mgnify:CR=1 FL=1
MVNLEDWQEINIGNDTTLKARIGWQGLTTSEYKDSGDYYLVTGTDFENGFVNWDTCHFVDKWRFDQDNNIQLKANDVLITKDGTIGKAGFIDTIKLPTTLNSGVFVIRTNSDKLDQKYLYYIFTSEIFDEFLNRLTAGSTINHLYQKDFIHFTFKAPKKEEQKVISKALSDTDKLISSLEKLISKKEDMKQGTMQQLLIGKKRLSGFSGEWEEKRLGDIGNPTMCKRIMKYETSETGEVPFYKIGTFGKEADSYITNKLFSDYKNRFSFPKKGDVLISASGTIGRIVVFDGKPSYFQDSNIVWINNNEKIVTNRYLSFIYQITKWSTEDTTIARLYNDNLKNLSILVPPTIEEQQAIAQILSDMDNEIESLKSKLSKTKAIKDGMMSELLTGKTRLI